MCLQYLEERQDSLPAGHLTCVLAGDAYIGSHRDFQPTADGVTVEGCDHQFGRVFKANKVSLACKQK